MPAAPFANLAEKVDPRHTALLVVDMQNDFCHPEGGWGKLGINLDATLEMAPRLERLADGARAASVPVIHIGTTLDEWVTSASWVELKKAYKPIRMLAPGSWGAEFFVKPAPADRLLTKHRYSAFADTQLDVVLRSKEIHTLVLTGTVTNVCVESTAREGFMKDYHIVLAADCCSAQTQAEHDATLFNIGKYFGQVVSSDELLSTWQEIPSRV